MLISIGLKNYVNSTQVSAITVPESAPIKRAIATAKDSELLIDATLGRPTRAVIFLQNGQVVLSSLNPENLQSKF